MTATSLAPVHKLSVLVVQTVLGFTVDSGQLGCHMVQTISVGITTEYKIALLVFTRHTQVPLTTYIIVYD